MAELNDLNVLAANNNFAAALGGWPETTMPVADVNNAAREDLAIIARGYRDQRGSLVSGGAADAQTLTTAAAHSAYFDGMTLTFRAGFTNTGATTLNVNTIGAQAVVKSDGVTGTIVPLDAADIVAGGLYRVTHDGTRFLLLNPSGFSDPQIVLTSVLPYSLASTGHALQLGVATGTNVVGDATGFQGRNNGAAARLYFQRVGGDITVGDPSAAHVEYGPAGIQGRSGALTATLPINAAGGTTAMGGSATVAGSLAVTGNVSTNGTITATNTINANNGITADGAIATINGESISSAGDLDCTNDATVGNDLTVLNDADVTGTLTAAVVEGEIHGDNRYSVVVGTSTLSAAQINGIVDADAGITVTLPDFAGGATLGAWAIVTNTSGGADATVDAATTLTGDGTISDGEAGHFICHGDGLWLRIS